MLAHIIAPDTVFSASEAADYMGRSTRQVQRYLDAGLLSGNRNTGRWQISALAIWRFRGIEEEMMSAWVDYCVRFARSEMADEITNTPIVIEPAPFDRPEKPDPKNV
ncbi:MAG: hypothetical protein R3D80_13155 [Paracoccaceae bacterium]